MRFDFEQPIPGRKVYINRENGFVIGDGNGFTPAELIQLRGVVKQIDSSPYTPEESAAIEAAEVAVRRAYEVRQEATARYFRERAALVRQAERDSEGTEHPKIAARLDELWRVVEEASEQEGSARQRASSVHREAAAAAAARRGAQLAAKATADRELKARKARDVVGALRGALGLT